MDRDHHARSDVARRLGALEAQVRTLRAVAGIAVPIALAMLLLGAAGRDGEVSGTRFVLVDSSGVAKAVLATDSEGAPMFTLMDGAAKPRVFLAVREGAPSIFLTDSAANAAIVMNVDADGSPVLRLRGADLNSSLSLGVGKAGDPRLVVADEVGKTRAVLGVAAVPPPIVSPGETPATGGRPATLVLLDGEGHVVYRAP